MTQLKIVYLLLVTIILGSMNVEADWCVARSDATYSALRIQLVIACSNGADCGPIGPGGSCFDPDTIQSHASYAFNSYYQNQNRAPDSCNFNGAATITETDPSYESCVYPDSLRVEGGVDTTVTTLPMNRKTLQD